MIANEYVLDSLSIQDSWRLFKILAEVVDGFDALSRLKRCVSIFGSARTKTSSKAYKDCVVIAKKLAELGYGVITGGGPGIMEAANKGATEAGGVSVGLHIHLPHEQAINQYVTTRCDFRYFFIRKLMFVKYAMAYVVMPGGMGTIDELSEAFVLTQTLRIKPFPIVLYDSSFWKGFIDWLRQSMVTSGYLQEEEIGLVTMLDTPDEVVSHIKKHVIV